MSDQGDERAGDGPGRSIRPPPTVMLAHAILLSAHRKEATRIELVVEPGPEPDELESCVHFIIEGDRQLELSPPTKLHDTLVGTFEQMSRGARDGRCLVQRGDEVICGITIDVRRPEGGYGRATIDVHPATSIGPEPATPSGPTPRSGPVRVAIIPVSERC